MRLAFERNEFRRENFLQKIERFEYSVKKKFLSSNESAMNRGSLSFAITVPTEREKNRSESVSIDLLRNDERA